MIGDARMCRRGIAAVAVAAVAMTAASAHADSRVLVMLDGDRQEALATALATELAALGIEVVRSASPSGDTVLARASAAQHAARSVAADAAVFVHPGPQGGASVRAVDAGGESIRHAPLPGPLEDVQPRVFALVAASLLEELADDPSRWIDFRIRVTVEANGETIAETTTEAQAHPPAAAPDAPAFEEAAPAGAGPEPRLGDVPEPPAPPVPEPPPDPYPTLVLGGVPADGPRLLFGGDVLPFVGTSSYTHGRDVRNVSVNLLGGLARGVEGFELGFGVNVLTGYLDGVQVAGVGNVVLGRVSGAQISPGFNWAGATSDGVQLSTAFNYVDGAFEGVQATVGGNWIDSDLEGVQAAVGLNVVEGDLLGVQGATGLNFVGGDLRGGQISMGANIATGRVDGVQATVGLNYAEGGSGLQLGAVNVQTEPFRGAQVGIVNVSQDADFALGLVNVVTEGRSHIELAVTESGFGLATFKHGGERWHYLYSVGTRPFSNQTVSFGLGLGGRATLRERGFLDVEALVSYLSDGDYGDDGTQVLSSLRLVGGLRLAPRFALIAGLTLNVLSAYNEELGRYSPYGAAELRTDPDPSVHWQVEMWPGAMVGAQLL